MKLRHLISGSARLVFLLALALSVSCAQTKSNKRSTDKTPETDKVTNLAADTATFAAGCFWCVEELFKQLDGVHVVISGYTGGHVSNPTYRQVITGRTGHAEACNIIYDPAEISYNELLAAFFVAHDPTQLNRQGADVGTQYRSAIFYHDDEQKKLADFYIQQLDNEGAYDKKIVTEVSRYDTFYVAEDYHQDYYVNNTREPYCQMVIKPKLEKFRKVFKGKLKEE